MAQGLIILGIVSSGRSNAVKYHLPFRVFQKVFPAARPVTRRNTLMAIFLELSL